MLHDYILEHRDRIIAHARNSVSRRTAPKASEDELEHGVPMFLTQLGRLLAPEKLTKNSPPAAAATVGPAATVRGGELLRRGFTVGQVVHDYGEICQAITAIASEDDAAISALEFRMLNQALDDAIALAVTEYARQRERSAAERENERMASFAQELRSLVSSASIAFEQIKRGSVGAGGSTGMLVVRSINRIGELVDRSLSELRLELGLCVIERFSVAMFMEEIEVSAAAQARQRSVKLVTSPIDYRVEISADRQILAAAVENLVHSALRHTRVAGEVSIRVTADKGRLAIAIADECGGLEPGQAERMLQSEAGKSAVENGARRLAFSRRGVEACGGELRASNRPGHGCVMTLELPLAPTTS